MKILTDNIVLHKDSHKYEHAETGLVNSVTTIIAGNHNKPSYATTEAMEYGNYVHSLIESYFKDNTKSDIETIRNCEKAKQILLTIDQLNIQPTLSEASFIVIDDNLRFGGTVDLVCNDRIIDYKTGGYYSYYDIQVSVYAYCMSKDKATVIYFQDNEVKYKDINKTEIEKNYKYFLSKLSDQEGRVYNIDLDDAEQLTNLLNEYNNLKEQEKALQIQSDEIKTKLASFLDKQNVCKYQINNYIITKQVRESKNLKPNFKKELLISNPEYFTVSKSNPFITINKLKVGENEQ